MRIDDILNDAELFLEDPQYTKVETILKNKEKDYKEDKFARHFYCDHARLNQLREDKKRSKRKTRRKNKKIEKWNILTI